MRHFGFLSLSATFCCIFLASCGGNTAPTLTGANTPSTSINRVASTALSHFTYLLVPDSKKLAVLDQASSTIVKTIAFDGVPYEVETSADGTRAAVLVATGTASSNMEVEEVAVVDTASNTIVRAIDLSGVSTEFGISQSECAMAIDAAGQNAYVIGNPSPFTTYGYGKGQLFTVDLNTGAVAQIPIADNPSCIATNPTGKPELYIPAGNSYHGNLGIYNTMTRSYRFVATGGNLAGVTISRDGSTAYLVGAPSAPFNEPGILYSIDLMQEAVSNTTAVVGGASYATELPTAEPMLYVNSQCCFNFIGNENLSDSRVDISIVNPRLSRYVSWFSVPTFSNSAFASPEIQFSHDGQLFYVPTITVHAQPTPPDTETYAVLIYSSSTRTLVKSIPGLWAVGHYAQ